VTEDVINASDWKDSIRDIPKKQGGDRSQKKCPCLSPTFIKVAPFSAHMIIADQQLIVGAA
jgi:hypothetical protein